MHRQKGLFLSVYVDDVKLAGKKQNIDPMWKVLNKEVDLGKMLVLQIFIFLHGLMIWKVMRRNVWSDIVS